MYNVLIVDDTKSVHAFVKNLLGKSPDIAVVSVFNGVQALEMLGQKPNEFDLILMDWEMPEMNGPETVVNLNKLNCQIPIIMMTTKNAQEDIVKMLDLGVQEYLIKPFTVDIIFDKISSVLGKELKYAS